MKFPIRSTFTALLALVLAISSCSSTPPRPRRVLPPGFVLNGHGQTARPYRVLIAGDSLSESMGPQLKRALSGYSGLEIFPIGKRSTGLCRPDFFNWPAVLEKNLAEVRPNLVFMWVGTNDNQNVYGMKGLGTPAFSTAWKQAYAKKMLEIITLCKRYNAELVFITPPVMPDGHFNDELQSINSLMLRACQYYHVESIDARSLLADKDGKFQRSITSADGKTTAIRTPDTVHITDAGNKIVMEKAILPSIYFHMYGSVPPSYKRDATGTQRRLVPTNRRGAAGIGGR